MKKKKPCSRNRDGFSGNFFQHFQAREVYLVNIWRQEAQQKKFNRLALLQQMLIEISNECCVTLIHGRQNDSFITPFH
jgi:hypothetical protein